MKLVLTLAFIAFLCSCGRAQINLDKLPRDISNVAFIKGKTGFLIDSLTIRTSLDTFPYGFAFISDTLLLDISIFHPVDELIVETFAEGHPFGRHSCWIDAPSADVHLSIAAGRTVIDSVGLSPMDRWFRKEVDLIRLSGNLTAAKSNLGRAILNNQDLLMCANFIGAFQDLPNLTRPDILWLKSTLNSELRSVKRHPWFASLLARQKAMQSNLRRKLKKYELSDQRGKVVELTIPKKQFFVLNFYDARLSDARRDHLYLKEILLTDSVFSRVPVISIARGDYVDGWLNYVKEGDFPWPHYLDYKPDLYDQMALFPASTYVLLNRKNQIEGLYDNLRQLTAALQWRKL